MSTTFQQQVIKSIGWVAVEKFSTQGIQFILSIIIARQLIPSDYGIIAMLAIFIAIANSFIDSGFNSALIQKQNRSDIDFSTVFYFNLVVSVIVYLIFIIISPYISSFYNEPFLIKIIPYVGLTLIINAFSTIQRCMIIINMDFKRYALISFVSISISGCVAVYMANNGFGVWTLVVQSILSGLITSALLWVTSSWKPLLVFSISSFRELFSFGSKLLMGGLLETIYSNLYPLIIGKFFPPKEVGLYSKGANFTNFLSVNITNILEQVVYPTLCKFQDNNILLTRNFYLILRLSACIVFPLMIGFMTLLEPIISVLLTDKWMGLVPYAKILCLASMWSPVKRFSWSILNVKHRSDYSLKSEILKKIVAITLLFCSIPFGVKGMCMGLVLYSIFDIIIITIFTKKVVTEINIFNHIKALAPILFTSALMGICIYVTIHFTETDLMKLILGFLVGVVSFVLISLVLLKDVIGYLITIIYGFIKR